MARARKASPQASADALDFRSEGSPERASLEGVVQQETRTYNRHALKFCRDGLGGGDPQCFSTSRLDRFQREHDALKAVDGSGLFTEEVGDLVEVHLPVTFESVSEALRLHDARARLAGGSVRLLTPAQAAAIFERWGVDPVASEELCGAPAPGLSAIDRVRATEARPAPYPIVGSVGVQYADPPEPSLTDLLRRLERSKQVEPSRPWWARAFERLVLRFGEDLIILAACCVIAAFFFGRTIISLAQGGSL